jgi:hypothetical protein
MSEQLDLFAEPEKDKLDSEIIRKASNEHRILYFDLETQKSADDVGGWGNIHEMKLAVDSMGKFNIPALLDSAPVGLRAMRKGKFPWKGHKSSEPDKVKQIFEKIEGK